MCMEMHQEVEHDLGVLTHCASSRVDVAFDASFVGDTMTQIQMFEKGKRMARCTRPVEEDSSDEEGGEQLACNMTGSNWEAFAFPIIVDSGACASVMPTGWCDHAPLKEIQQPRAGEFIRAANGQEIHNHGERVASMMTREGTMRDMRVTVCDVSKALGSVSQMCRAGHRVIFNPPWSPEGSCIQHMDTGECMWQEEHNGLYMLNIKVAPAGRHRGGEHNSGNDKGSGWHANP